MKSLNRSLDEYIDIVADTKIDPPLDETQITEVAALSFASQFGDGRVMPVLHAAAIITDTLDKCQCNYCRSER